MHKNGQVAIVETRGNKDCHVILRGGKTPNYDAASIAAACREIEAARLPCTLMVDCSHANSSKDHTRQIEVARNIAGQLKTGSRCIFGVMVESHLQSGAQKFSAGKDDPAKLAYGQSIRCLPRLGRFGARARDLERGGRPAPGRRGGSRMRPLAAPRANARVLRTKGLP